LSTEGTITFDGFYVLLWAADTKHFIRSGQCWD